MRSAALILALLLAGCDRPRDFDDRYAKAERAIRSRAADIDAELAEREREAGDSAASAAPTNAAPPPVSAPAEVRPRR